MYKNDVLRIISDYGTILEVVVLVMMGMGLNNKGKTVKQDFTGLYMMQSFTEPYMTQVCGHPPDNSKHTLIGCSATPDERQKLKEAL